MFLLGTATLKTFNMLKTKQVHCTYFQIKPNPMLAMNFAVRSLINIVSLCMKLYCTSCNNILRPPAVIQSSGQAELERLVRQPIHDNATIGFLKKSQYQMDLQLLCAEYILDKIFHVNRKKDYYHEQNV